MTYVRFLLLFAFLTFWKYNVNAQEQRFSFTQSRSVDFYGDVIYDWHAEQNTIVINADGNSETIRWILTDGSIISFYNVKKTTGSDPDGYYYEEYEASYWNTEFEEEDVAFIRRFTEDGLLIISFWDGQEAFFP